MTTGPQNQPSSGASLQEILKDCASIALPKYGIEPVVAGGGASVAPALEAYKNLRSRLMKAQERMNIRSVVVTSATHSEGKTITAFNLAYCCAQLENSPVLLVDGDLRTHGLTQLTGAQTHPGLRDILGNVVPYAGAIVATDCANLYVMGAGQGDATPAELFSTQVWSDFIAWASQFFRFVIVDAPPVGVVADMNLIEAGCHGSLVVVRAHRSTQQALEDALAQLDSKKVIGVVWNEAKQYPEAYPYPYTGKKT